MRSLLISGLLISSLAIGCKRSEQATPSVKAPATTMPAGEAANKPAMETPAIPAAGADEATTTSSAATVAQQKLAQVAQYVRDHKYDLAQKLLDEVEAEKASLPESIQKQIQQARETLNAAKAASGAGNMTVPGMK